MHIDLCIPAIFSAIFLQNKANQLLCYVRWKNTKKWFVQVDLGSLYVYMGYLKLQHQVNLVGAKKFILLLQNDEQNENKCAPGVFFVFRWFYSIYEGTVNYIIYLY